MTLKYEKISTEIWDEVREIPECPDKGAFEISYGDYVFFVVDGKRHREDGPAITFPDGTQKYYQNGKLHRLDGPTITWDDGTQIYFQHGSIHREDGPAVIYPDGSKYYHHFGDIHRLDGPAIISPDGFEYYFLFNKQYSKEEWEPLAIQINLKEQIV